MKRPGPADRRHFKRLLSRNHLWVAGKLFMQLGGRIHLFPHIKVVVGCRTVCSETYCHVLSKHLGNGRNTRGKLHVRLRIVSPTYTKAFKNVDLFVREPYQMGG